VVDSNRRTLSSNKDMLVQSIHYMSASELAALIRTRALSPVEVIKETLDRIEAVNPLINA